MKIDSPKFIVPTDTIRLVQLQGDFAVGLADTLKEKNITLKELSVKTGIRVYRLKEILAGNANLTMKTISKIESAIEKEIL